MLRLLFLPHLMQNIFVDILVCVLDFSFLLRLVCLLPSCFKARRPTIALRPLSLAHFRQNNMGRSERKIRLKF